MLRDRAGLYGGAASLVLHAVIALFLLRLPAPADYQANDAPAVLDLEITDPGGDGDEVVAAGRLDRTRPIPLVPGGPDARQNIDARSRGGRGDESGAMEVILLLPRDQGTTLQDSPMTSYETSQTSRLRTARERLTAEDRRATPNPHDQVFVASGTGRHPERRPLSEIDPRTGARVAPPASTTADPESAAPQAGHRAGAPSAATSADGLARAGREGDARARDGERRTEGGPSDSPGVGIRRGTGARESESAPVARGRPPVDPGPAATPSDVREDAVSDDVDAELLAAQMTQSWVESTRRSGARRGPGRGGVGGGGDPGSGGRRGPGGQATPYGPGPGDHASLDTSDSRYIRWYLQQRRRVAQHLRFPREREVAMDQGTSVWRVVVRRDGSLVGEPRLVRTSGFDDLDRAAREAIVRATPFSPLPAELVPGAPTLAVPLTIEHQNPMVN